MDVGNQVQFLDHTFWILYWDNTIGKSVIPTLLHIYIQEKVPQSRLFYSGFGKGKISSICLFYCWCIQYFEWVVGYLEGMNSWRRRIFPNYFRSQLKPYSQEWIIRVIWSSFLLFITLKIGLKILGKMWCSLQFIPYWSQMNRTKTWMD